MAKVAPGSSLHRLLGVTPGYAPAWFCSRDTCTGIDLLILTEVGVVFASLLLGQFQGWWWLVPFSITGAVLFGVKLHAPFQSRERWGRARRRRGECVWCGEPGVGSGAACGSCGCRGE